MNDCCTPADPAASGGAQALIRPGPLSRALRVLVGIVFLAATIHGSRAMGDLSTGGTHLVIGALVLFGLGWSQLWRVPYAAFVAVPALAGLYFVRPGSPAADILLPSTAFIGLSFLIAGLRGNAGCEITAIPNLFRKEPVEHGCPALWDAIDRWEAEWRRPA